MVAFTIGALLPLLTMMLVGPTRESRSPWCRSSSPSRSRVGQRPALLRAPGRAVLRNIAGGLFAMAVTYGIGSLLGTQI